MQGGCCADKPRTPCTELYALMLHSWITARILLYNCKKYSMKLHSTGCWEKCTHSTCPWRVGVPD